MARTASMDIIEKALQEPEPITGDESAIPTVVPGVQTPSRDSLTADDDARIERQDDEEEVSERQKIIDDAIRQRQEEKDVFQQSANDTINAVQKVARNTGVAIERLPSPGSVMLPLLVLGIFFFLLLPVNGHTRLTWLWLVVTGNASTGGAAQAPIFSELNINAPAIINPGQSAHLPTMNTSSGLSFAGNQEPT